VQLNLPNQTAIDRRILYEPFFVEIPVIGLLTGAAAARCMLMGPYL
jgi:hypothetical protein